MSAGGPTNDVAIYTASSTVAGLYDRTLARAGGAERQMTLLARVLSTRGHRVAHIVHAPKDPVPLPNTNLSLVYRAAYAGAGRGGGLREAVRLWRALKAADARVIIIRTASPSVGVAALFCKLNRRGLIFSAANNKDFILDGIGRSRQGRVLFRLGTRLSDAIVVQSNEQLELARRAFPQSKLLVHIPSFAEFPSRSEVSPEEPRAFLWVGRLEDYKRPMHYVELARAVPEARFVMILARHGSMDFDELVTAARDVSNLEVLEPLPHARLMDLLTRSVAVVNTSSLEGMPNAFLEAWVHGVPVLTFEFDPDGIVAQRRLGVSAAGSWERFVTGARALWRNGDDRGELADRARAYVRETHSIERVGRLWEDLLEQIGHPD